MLFSRPTLAQDPSINPARAFLATLRAARDKAGLTQQELADRLGKPQSFVAKYENGERRIDVVEFVALADAIGVEPLSLFRAFLKRAREA